MAIFKVKYAIDSVIDWLIDLIRSQLDILGRRGRVLRLRLQNPRVLPVDDELVSLGVAIRPLVVEEANPAASAGISRWGWGRGGPFWSWCCCWVVHVTFWGCNNGLKYNLAIRPYLIMGVRVQTDKVRVYNSYQRDERGFPCVWVHWADVAGAVGGVLGLAESGSDWRRGWGGLHVGVPYWAWLVLLGGAVIIHIREIQPFIKVQVQNGFLAPRIL